tara:strand:+ start:68 stop:250 length:183 start_codon:yes stop_codon:yes gene_type:complete
MTREVYIKIHNKLIEEYLEENPEADAAEVYDKTADLAGDAYGDYLATNADLARDLAKNKT